MCVLTKTAQLFSRSLTAHALVVPQGDPGYRDILTTARTSPVEVGGFDGCGLSPFDERLLDLICDKSFGSFEIALIH
jgi:hypothetical protein